MLIIFDLDGTLIDAYDAIARSFNATMAHLGYPAQPKDRIRRAVGWGDRNLLKPFVSRGDLDAALAFYRRHHAQSLVSHSRLFPGVRALLARLRKRHHRLAVASNRPTRFSLMVIRHLGLAGYFDYVLCADKLARGKPHPLILRRIMRRFRASPSQTLYVGDMPIDGEAGRRAGVRTVLVTTGSGSLRDLKEQHAWRIIPAVRRLSGLDFEAFSDPDLP